MYHEHKDETSYVLSGRLIVTHGETQDSLVKVEAGLGYVWRNKPYEIHTVEVVEDSQILEVSTQEVDDIVRLVDNYGRAGKTDGG